LSPRYALQEAMRAAALRALEDADVIVYVADAAEGTPLPLTEAAGLERAPKAAIITALNKSDTLSRSARENFLARDILLVSALTGEGIEELIARVERSEEHT